MTDFFYIWPDECFAMHSTEWQRAWKKMPNAEAVALSKSVTYGREGMALPMPAKIVYLGFDETSVGCAPKITHMLIGFNSFERHRRAYWKSMFL